MENNIYEKVCMEENEKVWNQSTYDAWIERFGTPSEAIKKIYKLNENPSRTLETLFSKFGDVQGKKIMNLMGSNGTKAVALALRGAEVTVVDFSEENKKYALELAKAGNVKIEYILSDVLKLFKEELVGKFDIVFAETGILHYFSDLKPFVEIVKNLLSTSGIFVIRDFHPVSTKLITSKGTTAKIRKHKVTGDYFDKSLEEKDVAFAKYSKDSEPKKVYLRKWNLGEIVTAVASEGLVIKSLDEEPHLTSELFDKGIPKTFLLVATKQ